ncbi:alpha-amylase family glycosyl hydrolase [Micromonosporaceae bacterium Da 78-11]
MSEPEWVRHAVWWQIYPLGFVGAYPDRGDRTAHRLSRVESWLDYAVELGASGLALGPIFASGTHGYDTVDHLRIDPRLGDDGDFDSLVAAAHDRGLKVLLDGVFNHVGRDHPAFQAALRDGPDSATASWFRIHWRPGQDPKWDDFEGHADLPALNHDSPAVIDLVAGAMKHWLARGADAWRLDVAYAVPPGFWAEVVRRVRAEFPDAYFVGEMIGGDYPEFVQASTLDSVTQYELWKAIWSSLNEGNFFELSWALERHNTFLGTFAPMTFVGNHDVTRIASRLTDERDLPIALALLLTVGGTPSIYAGDEQAFRGDKEDRAGGDDAIRPAFPEKPDGLAPYGRPTYRLHQELIGLRRRHDWLHRARVRNIHLTNEQFVYEATDGARALLVAVNIADAVADVPSPYAQGVLAGNAGLSRAGSGEAQVRLAPHAFAVLEKFAVPEA